MTTHTRAPRPAGVPPVDPFDLPVELRRRRQDRGMSQNEVGAMLGFTGAMVGLWERGDLDPHWTTVLRWAAALGLDITVRETPRG